MTAEEQLAALYKQLGYPRHESPAMLMATIDPEYIDLIANLVVERIKAIPDKGMTSR